MPTRKISAARDHLARMVGARTILGVAEVVWNALDAEAQRVDVRVSATASGAVDEIVVTDKGHGVRAEEVGEPYLTVGCSWVREKHPSYLPLQLSGQLTSDTHTELPLKMNLDDGSPVATMD